MFKITRLATALCFINATQSVVADTPKPLLPSDPALESALLYDGDGEGVALKGMAKHDFDPASPGVEQLVLWTMIGPTYWSTFISVVSKQSGQWRSLARLNLDGTEAEINAVGADGLIMLNAKTPGPNDPICCPSQQKRLNYRFTPIGTGDKATLKLVP